MENLDIKNFTKLTGIALGDYILFVTQQDRDGKLQLSLLIDYIKELSQPTINEETGTWQARAASGKYIDTGIQAEGKTPVLKKGDQTSAAILWKYEGESETAWKPLVEWSAIRLNVADLTQEQLHDLKLSYSDLTEDDKDDLRSVFNDIIVRCQEAAEAAESSASGVAAATNNANNAAASAKSAEEKALAAKDLAEKAAEKANKEASELSSLKTASETATKAANDAAADATTKGNRAQKIYEDVNAWFDGVKTDWNDWFTARKTEWTDWLTARLSEWNTWWDARKAEWKTWFTDGVVVTWNNWFSDSLATGVRKIWNDWFAARKTEWTTLSKNVTDATTQANTAASNANTKASLADEKAKYANEQGTYAKNQGDFANEIGENPPYIGDDGYWYNYDYSKKKYIKTEVYAKGGATYLDFSINPETMECEVNVPPEDRNKFTLAEDGQIYIVIDD